METKEQKRVLVVEDEAIPRRIYTEKFRSLGAHVVSVSSVEEAKKALENGRFTHVISDGLEGGWKELVPEIKSKGVILRVVSGRPIGDEVKATGASFVDKFDLVSGRIPIGKLINE